MWSISLFRPAGHIQLLLDRFLIRELVQKGSNDAAFLYFGHAGMGADIGIEPLQARFGHDLFEQGKFAFKRDGRDQARPFPASLCAQIRGVSSLHQTVMGISGNAAFSRSIRCDQRMDVGSPPRRYSAIEVKAGGPEDRGQEGGRVADRDEKLQLVVREHLPKKPEAGLGRCCRVPAAACRHLGGAKETGP